MKYTKLGLRLWIAMSSVAGFLGGWALLAHSPKPAQPVQNQPVVESTPLATLAPLPSFNQRNQGIQQFPTLTQNRGFKPRLRTGGS